jgi:DNA-binding protein H-NS
MTKTLQQIEAQIQALKVKAEAIRLKEKAGVIQKINVALAHYAITPEELTFFSGGTNATVASKKPRRARGTGPAKPKAVNPPMYADGKGNQWTGIGQRPKWFLEALAAGIDKAELAQMARDIKSQALAKA